MATRRKSTTSNRWLSRFLHDFGWDLLLGLISAFYVFMVPYTKVEESFNVQAMHDILYHHHHIEKYDHLEFPGVVPRTFLGALLVSILASPVVLLMHVLHIPKIYSLHAVRLVLGCIVLSTLRFFRIEVRRKFGYHVEGFFVLLTSVQFHFLFYSTRPLPNILALCLVNLAYAFWFRGNALATLRCLTFAAAVFRCDVVLLFGPIGVALLLCKLISVWEAMKCCISAAFFCIGVTMLVDSLMWRKILWPELEVFWFNSVLNRSSEWGTHSFHWYFSSALPRSLLIAYPLCMFGVLLDQRIWQYIFPVFSFVLLYSKLPHKELRFIIGAIPILNLSAAITASRVYNNRKKGVWRWLYMMMLGSLLVSLGCSFLTFMASYDNYPGAHALKTLHQTGTTNSTSVKWVHIDPFTAMNGVSRFSENNSTWRYSKEEGIALDAYQQRNFTYLLSEHAYIDGFKCLFTVYGFSGAKLRLGFPPVVLLKAPKVYVHGSLRHDDIPLANWNGCP